MTKNIIGSLLFICSVIFSVGAFAQDQAAKDDQILKEYFAKNNIKASKTASGLYYVITKEGSGETAKANQKVHMYYYGKFMDGKKFDANVDENFKPVAGRDPLVFTLGVGQVIRGWDEGVQLLKPGTRATLYLPSGIGYGSANRGPIPANSILVFDVELISVDK